MKQYYVLTQQELLSLLTDCLKLTALDKGGVDNWEWYGDSIGDFIKDQIKEHHLDPAWDWEMEDVAKLHLKDYSMFTLYD